MGMADDIRRQRENEQRKLGDAAVRAEYAYEQFHSQINRIASECATALRELGVQPTFKLGFLKYGWLVEYPQDLADENPIRHTIIIRQDGTWISRWDATKKPKPKRSFRQDWIEKYTSMPHRLDPLLPDEAVRQFMQSQVHRLLDRSKR